jgi:ceramide glucosyltransferase
MHSREESRSGDPHMTPLAWLLLAFCVVATGLHVGTAILAMHRCRRRQPLPALPGSPPVSILRPVCGRDSHDEATLRSGFALDYPDYELVFCCSQAGDPAVALVERLIGEHPGAKARLLIGNHSVSANPKLNNLVKGWRAANHGWIIMADSNVLMPRDYVQRLLSGWRHDTGILCSPPIGCLPTGFAAELECAFLNTYQARWQYAADCIGFGFAQGKTMVMRRRDLESAGGITALAAEVAEDAAATKVVRRLGLSATLVDAPFGQPLGIRAARQVWDRQTRWARLRRMSFPGCFAAEILTGSLLPLAAAAYVADAIELPAAALVAGLAALWFGCEALLACVAGWHLSAWSPLAWALRDALLPLVWMHAWLGDGYAWRGNEIRTAASGAQAH